MYHITNTLQTVVVYDRGTDVCPCKRVHVYLFVRLSAVCINGLRDPGDTADSHGSEVKVEPVWASWLTLTPAA